jgi:hypothetical protein
MLDKTYCTNKECTKKCDDRLTLEVETAARLHGKMLTLHAELCKDHVETKGGK